MPKEIQNPRTSSGLVAALGLKGRFPLQADEVCVNTFNVLNLEQTPYAREAKPCSSGGTQAAAGAGIYSAIAVVAAPGVILEVRSVIVVCTTNQGHTINFMDGTTLAGSWTEVGRQNLVYGGVEDPQTTPVLPYHPIVQSTFRSLTRNLIPPTGSRVAYLRGAALTGTLTVTFPYGFFLDGDAALGPPGLLVCPIQANLLVEGSFFCREFEPKG